MLDHQGKLELLQVVYFRVEISSVDLQSRDGDGEGEATGAGAAGVDVDHTMFFFDEWFVGVTEDDNIDTGRSGINVELFAIMDNEKRRNPLLKEELIFQLFGPGIMIDIAPDRHDRGNGSKPVQNMLFADITSVNNEIYAMEYGVDVVTIQSVSI